MARGRKTIAYSFRHCPVWGSGSSALACFSSTMCDRCMEQAAQTSCKTSCTAISPQKDGYRLIPGTIFLHVSQSRDLVSFLGTFFQLSLTTCTPMLQIKCMRQISTWQTLLRIQAVCKAYPVSSAPLSQRYTTTSARLSSSLKHQRSPTYMQYLHETHPGAPSKARTRKMQHTCCQSGSK